MTGTQFSTKHERDLLNNYSCSKHEVASVLSLMYVHQGVFPLSQLRGNSGGTGNSLGIKSSFVESVPHRTERLGWVASNACV